MSKLAADEIQALVAQGRKHCMVFLKPGPTRDHDEATAQRIQLEHLQHLFALVAEGKLVVNGPLMGRDDILGVSIYDSGDRAAVEAWVRADPAVVAGRLVYEIHDWFAIDGHGYPSSGAGQL
jgi:uncharacterized protein YciI